MRRSLSCLILALCCAPPLAAADDGPLTRAQEAFLATPHEVEDPRPLHLSPCINGVASGYPCSNVDLLEFLPLASIGGGTGNDVWGWTDPDTQREYALMGRSNGTAFVDITDPEAAVYLGNLPTQTGNSLWRDIKVYNNHAFIVSEASNHGLQVFDLTRLRNVVSPPVTFTVNAHYNQFGRAHNLVINEQSGFAYAVGSVQGTTTCSGGLHMVDIRNPTAPTFAGCFSSDGYTHDAQCVNYAGPDTTYVGHEICFGSNEDTLTIVDVTTKAAPAQLSRTTYAGSAYTHQGWLTEDQRYFLIDDELDESNFGHTTRSYVWDVSNLDAPVLLGHFAAANRVIDHNQYVKGNHVYQANYQGGLRILRIEDAAAARLSEVAYFDIYPASNNPNFNGAWSVYPYFPSGNVIVSGIEQGLFVLRPNLCSPLAAPGSLVVTTPADQRIDLSWAGSGTSGNRFRIERGQGTCATANFVILAEDLLTTTFSDTTVSGQIPYAYRFTEYDATGLCTSPASTCIEATATGPCTAGPLFAGVETGTDVGTASCQVDLAWPAATTSCGGAVSYTVYRGKTADFVPTPAERVATGLLASPWRDPLARPGDNFYRVRAVDAGNGAEDTNSQVLRVAATGPPNNGTWTTGGEVNDVALELGTGGDALAHVAWHTSTARFHAGGRSYFSGYEAGNCLSATSPPITLTAGELSTLSFWTAYDIETNFDGGVVEVSVNGGAWQALPVSPPYPSQFNNSSDACGFVGGRPSFSGTSLTWTQYTADLSDWSGQPIRLRWRFSTDGANQREGWYLDDIAISSAQVPSMCTSGLLFRDGFETGSTAAWGNP